MPEFCPDCNRQNNGNASFCIGCGWSFQASTPKIPLMESRCEILQNEKPSAHD